METDINKECLSSFIQYYIYKIYPYNYYRRIYEENIVDLVLATKPSDVFPPENADDCLYKGNQFQIEIFKEIFDDFYPFIDGGSRSISLSPQHQDQILNEFQSLLANGNWDRFNNQWIDFIQNSLEVRDDNYLANEHLKKDKKVADLRRKFENRDSLDKIYEDLIFSIFTILCIYYRRKDKADEANKLIKSMIAMGKNNPYENNCFFWHLRAAMSESNIIDNKTFEDELKVASNAIEIAENNIKNLRIKEDRINSGVYLNYAVLVQRAYEYHIFKIKNDSENYQNGKNILDLAIKYAKRSFEYRPGYAKFNAIYAILLYYSVLETDDTPEKEQEKLNDALKNIITAILHEKKHQNQYVSRTAQWEKFRLDIDMMLKQMKFNSQNENEIKNITAELSNNKR